MTRSPAFSRNLRLILRTNFQTAYNLCQHNSNGKFEEFKSAIILTYKNVATPTAIMIHVMVFSRSLPPCRLPPCRRKKLMGLDSMNLRKLIRPSPAKPFAKCSSHPERSSTIIRGRTGGAGASYHIGSPKEKTWKEKPGERRPGSMVP